MEESTKARIDQACRTAEEFTKFYYDHTDKKKHLMGRMYHETGLLTWNGNAITGSERIQKFIMDLPSTEHVVVSLDAQPVLDSAVNDQLTFLIQVSGNVKYQDRVPKCFQQSFLITAQNDKWKIVSDCFRLQEPIIGSSGEKS